MCFSLAPPLIRTSFFTGFNSVIKTTIKFPNALFMNQKAVRTVFIDCGAWRKANWIPGIDNSTSPIMRRKNCGNCHRTEIVSSGARWKLIDVKLIDILQKCIRINYVTWTMISKNPAQMNDPAADIPPSVILATGVISNWVYFSTAGSRILSQRGMSATIINGATDFIWSGSK